MSKVQAIVFNFGGILADEGFWNDFEALARPHGLYKKDDLSPAGTRKRRDDWAASMTKSWKKQRRILE
jgi:hypothetical protein